MVLTFLLGKSEGIYNVKMGVGNVSYQNKLEVVTKFGGEPTYN